MTERLRNCPFCGGEAQMHTFRTYSTETRGMESRYYVCCRGCGIEQLNYRSEKEAREAWNRRADGYEQITAGD